MNTFKYLEVKGFMSPSLCIYNSKTGEKDKFYLFIFKRKTVNFNAGTLSKKASLTARLYGFG
jgi:hypothetical protein